MIRNYFKLGLRHLLKQKAYSIINIVGLSVGLAAFLLIALHIQYEMGYNQHIPNGNQLYRCVEIQHAPGVGEQHVAVTMGPLGKALVNDFPEVEKVVRMLYWGSQPLHYGEQFFDERFVVFADPSVFELFGLRLLVGDTAQALAEPNSFVVSENLAKKIFGAVDQAMGKVLQINGRPFVVSGVMENQPEQSSFRMEALIPFDYMESKYTWLRGWNNNSIDTYVKLRAGVNMAELEEKFPAFISQHTETEDNEEQWKLYLQPVHDIHLKSGHIKFQIMNNHQGSISMVYVFSIVALLIILLACVNFINLAIAQTVKRSKEVGLRKVMGAERVNLIGQFLGESTILTFISMMLALMIAEIMLPYFNQLLGTSFHLDFLTNPLLNIGLVIMLVLVSLVAGFYPAFYLSKLNPIAVMRSGSAAKGSSSAWLTKALVIFQFVISIAMIFSAGVVYDQFKFVLQKDLGINYTNILSVKLYDKNDLTNVEFLKHAFRQNPQVLDVAFVSDVNGVAGSQSSVNVDDSTETVITMRFGFVDYNFFNMMDIPVIAGRNFSREYAFDDSSAVVINRAAAQFLGWDDPVGKQFKPFLDTVTNMKVIGVIEDYHYYSLHSKIEPAIYMIDPDRSFNLAVKISDANKEETLAFLESVWDEHFPGVPFSYYMASDRLRDEYKSEESTFKIFSMFTFLSMVISCLGLYGLTALTVERKSREIGIRKVFGGSIPQILNLLTFNAVRLILIAGVIATPVAYYLMDRALANFAYHISITWKYFAVSILSAMLVAVVTIIYHALRAATSNPVDVLHYE